MAKWVVILVGLALAVGIGAGTAFALTDSGDNPAELDSQGITDETQGEQGPIRSDEGIDPEQCNLVHNINACTPEDLETLGGALISGSIGVEEPEPGVEVEGKPEPLSLDGGPGFKIKCDEGEGVYITSTGEVGCTALFALEAVGEAETQKQLPQVEPQVP